MKKLLVFKEKHGDRYFDATTEEQLHAAALHVLTERYESGDWYFEPEPLEEPLADEQIAALPEGRTKRCAEEERADWKRRKRAYDVEVYDFQRIKTVCAAKDGKSALKILGSRSRNEYEYVEVADVEEPVP